MQIFIGFRPNHIKLRAEHIEGRIGLVIIEDEQQFLGHRRQFAFETATRFSHACSGCEPFFVRLLLCCLIDVAEDGQQVMKLVLGQSSQCFHLTVVSDLHPHRLAPSMTFWRIAYRIIYWGTTLLLEYLTGCGADAHLTLLFVHSDATLFPSSPPVWSSRLPRQDDQPLPLISPLGGCHDRRCR